MTLEEFSRLSLSEKSQFVSTKGKYLVCRKGLRYTCNLFAVEDFFAEVWYKMENDSIIEIIGFSDQKGLDSYLDDLPMEGLL